ncbi:MAG: hypothetical protein JNN30_15245 [Rhodanobacteraceae bacterium]|nr:hypothetical protein [Rhodanobacteraceae bacterium]
MLFDRRLFLATALCGLSVAAQAQNPVQQGAPELKAQERAATIERRVLADRLIQKWRGYVIEVYGASAEQPWLYEFRVDLAKASESNLEAALKKRTYESMFAVLSGARLSNDEVIALANEQADGSGSFSPKALGDAASDLVFIPVTRCRLVDTRLAGGPIAAGTTRDFDITGAANYSAQGGAGNDCGIGGAGSFRAAVLSVEVPAPVSTGYLTLYPYLTTQPAGASLNYAAGVTASGEIMAALDQGAPAQELSVFSLAQADVVIDVVGYYINPQATTLQCTNTSVSSFTISANSLNFFNNPACPPGYSAITPYCWTASTGVYSQGSGYNANSPSGQTFCAWQNTTVSSQTTFGGNVCCRVPGR